MMINAQKLTKEEFNIPCKKLALYLIGKVLVRKLEDGTILKGRIVETECYLGGVDKASHSYNGRKTAANAPMFMAPGTAYVYMTYGMYYCFNISSAGPGAAVLLRSLEPFEGLDTMKQFRSAKRKENSKPLKDTDLCNGPSKLCMAFNIRKDNCNKLDLTENEALWLEDDGECMEDKKVIITSRIGIASVGVEWASKPLRFYVYQNLHVSKRDKQAEKDVAMNEKN